MRDPADYLIRTAWAEAGNQSFEGKAAVMHTILNRALKGSFGGRDIPSVVTAPKQFEPWNTPEGRARMASLRSDSPEYQELRGIAEGIAAGKVPDITGGATHFANVATVRQRGDSAGRPGGWIEKMAPTAVKIGDHTFFGGDPVAARAARLAGPPLTPTSPAANPDPNLKLAPGQFGNEPLPGFQAIPPPQNFDPKRGFGPLPIGGPAPVAPVPAPAPVSPIAAVPTVTAQTAAPIGLARAGLGPRSLPGFPAPVVDVAPIDVQPPAVPMPVPRPEGLGGPTPNQRVQTAFDAVGPSPIGPGSATAALAPAVSPPNRELFNDATWTAPVAAAPINRPRVAQGFAANPGMVKEVQGIPPAYPATRPDGGIGGLTPNQRVQTAFDAVQPLQSGDPVPPLAEPPQNVPTRQVAGAGPSDSDLVRALANYGNTATSTYNEFGGSPSMDFLIRNQFAASPPLIQALLGSSFFGV